MTIQSLLTQTVTIRRAGTPTTDPEGNTVTTYTGQTVQGRVEQSQSVEVADGRQVVTSWWRAFLPPDVTVEADDRIESDDGVFEVDGRPNVARTPRGPHHLEVRLRTVE